MNIRPEQIKTAGNAKSGDHTDTLLERRWHLLARSVWFILAALALFVFVVSFPVYIAQLNSICDGSACGTGQLTPQFVDALRSIGLFIDKYVVISVALTFLQAFVWFTVGGLLFWRKSNDWIALLVALMMVFLGTST